MLKIVIFVSFVSVACGTQYAYFGNNVLEFEDPPASKISLPYPYTPLQQYKIANTAGELEPAATNDVEAHSMAVAPSPPATSPCTALTKLDLILAPFTFICSLTTKVFGYIKRAIMYVVTSLPALIFGSNFSTICKFLNIDPYSYLNDLSSSFVGPERLKRATEFVTSAINKYQELQNA